jgi:hypothetical protein
MTGNRLGKSIPIAILVATVASPTFASAPPACSPPGSKGPVSPPRHELLDLPAGASSDWWTSVQAEVGRREYFVTWSDETGLPGLPGRYQAPNRSQGFRTLFGERGILLVPRSEAEPGWEWGLSLAGIRRGQLTGRAAPTAPIPFENQVSYSRGDIEEWYVNDPKGLEQGFTIRRPLLPGDSDSGDASPFALELALSGTLHPIFATDRKSVDFVATGGGVVVLRFSQLRATDATGRDLPARLEPFSEPESPGIRIVVDDRDAVYPVTVDPMTTVPAWTMVGYTNLSKLGWSVAAAGDLNGDGYGDVAVGAPFALATGRVFVYLGSASGLASTPWATLETGEYDARLGWSVATAGDVNGDGYSDLVVGAPYKNSSVGFARVYFGGASGLTLNVEINPPAGTLSNSWFGYSVSTAGDVNGDGYSDVLIGAPGISGDQAHEGAAFVYFGSPSGVGVSANWGVWGNVEVYTPIPGSFGTTVSTAGDVNGDGYSDFIVGRESPAGAWIYHGSATSPTCPWSSDIGDRVAAAGDVNGDGYSDVLVSNFDDGDGVVRCYHGSASGLSATPNRTLTGIAADGEFGFAIATAGDLNGDGYSDVVIGSPAYASFSPPYQGRAVAFYGSPSGLESTQSWSYGGSVSLTRGVGSSAATAGDVNGDGYSDLIVGQPYFSSVETEEGRAFVFLGSPDGPSSSAGWSAIGGQAGAQFGFSVASAGDLNGDGYGDVAVGAVYYDNGQTDEGAAFVYMGSPSGPEWNWSWMAESNQASSYFGRVVAGLISVNGDGYSDLAVGAARFDRTTTGGKVFVWHGSATGLGANGNPTNADWTGQIDQAEALYGVSVASAGDVNCDGFGDLVVGADYYDDGQADEGAAFVYLGSKNGLGASWSWKGEADQASAYFGASVAGAGDFNGDGCSDIVVGAPYYTSFSASEGEAFAWFGSPAGLGANGTPANSDWHASVGEAGAQYGLSVASAGDVNGDHFSDLVVGAPNLDVGGYADNGVVFVYHGSASGPSTSPDSFRTIYQAGARLGTAVASAGDVNGDGYSDVLGGAPYYDGASGVDAGRALVWLGSAAGIDTSSALVVDGTEAGANFGRSVAGGGDVNGDGFADLLVGAPKNDATLTDEGLVILHYGGGGSGRGVRPLQRSFSSSQSIDRLGRSDLPSSLALRGIGFDLLGRCDFKLEWEMKPFGSAFDGTGLQRSAAWHDTGVAGVSVSEGVTGLSESLYHWRLRVLRDPVGSPFQRFGPWKTMPASGAEEAKVRLWKDSDDDGHPDDVDCAPSNPALWQVPSVARALTLQGNPPGSLVWTAPLDPGGNSVLYDLLRSPSPDNFSSGTTCVASGISALSASDSTEPASGQVLFYVVRSKNDCGGNLGSNSKGVPRSGRICP